MPPKGKSVAFSVKLIGVRLRDDYVRSLKVLSAKTDQTIMSLLEEAVGDLLKKYHQEVVSKPYYKSKLTKKDLEES